MDVECYVLGILLLFFPARIRILEELGVVVRSEERRVGKECRL